MEDTAVKKEVKAKEHTAMKQYEGQKRKRFIRKRVVVDEEVTEFPDQKLYEPVTFRFYNEEQRKVPVPYEWIDKWTKIGQCKGMFYDGKTYTLPRVAYEYYRDNCYEPIRADVEQEIYPGQTGFISQEVGRKHRFRLEEVRS